MEIFMLLFLFWRQLEKTIGFRGAKLNSKNKNINFLMQKYAEKYAEVYKLIYFTFLN